MFKNILIIVYILIFGILTYYVTHLFINRNQEIIEEQPMSNTENSFEDESLKNITQPPVDDIVEIEEIEVTQQNSAYVITKENCTHNCSDTDDTEKQKYCKQVCGLIQPSQEKACSDLTNLEKDYCLRDTAVTANDITQCNEIKDEGINQQCINRINEDFIDNVM